MKDNSDDIKEVAGYGLGSILVGGFAGWLLGRMTGEKDRDFKQVSVIQEYNMDDFISFISQEGLSDLDADKINNINVMITNGVYNRLKVIETEDELNELFDDLEATQNFIEAEAIEEDNYDEIIPIVNHFQDMIQVLDHFDSIDEMLEYLGEF